ncbi:PfkB family carbohydrate kinase [Limnohabitans sp.]|uniref:PfkB family carbohydrate kinase n=1 Tax=Limnohabitans sp. TaxID=1907725 RepID=UPI00286FA99C|nr:PfkB family carbohydrate kinase [Limnohabitans sp.]
MTDQQPIRVAIAGEALIDFISETDGRFNPCLGGAVYNLARALARQGMGTLYLNPFSSDQLGQALMQQMLDDGVELAQTQAVQAVTSLAVVNLNDSGHPSYAFYRDGVADRQITSVQMNADCAHHASTIELICTGALALDARDEHVYLPWLSDQKAAGKCIVVDANLRPSVMPDLKAYRHCVHHFLDVADIIKVSDEDLLALEIPGQSALEKAHHLLNSTHANLIALTLGADGAWLLSATGDAYFGKENAALNIIDTVGAGDSFLAGLLAALSHLKPVGTPFNAFLTSLHPEQATMALSHAIASASLCVQARGCVPPTWSQASQWALNHSSQSQTSASVQSTHPT